MRRVRAARRGRANKRERTPSGSLRASEWRKSYKLTGRPPTEPANERPTDQHPRGVDDNNSGLDNDAGLLQNTMRSHSHKAIRGVGGSGGCCCRVGASQRANTPPLAAGKSRASTRVQFYALTSRCGLGALQCTDMHTCLANDLPCSP